MMLKLFVWEDVLCDYTAGIMFALAATAEDARQLVWDTFSGTKSSWKEGIWADQLEAEPKVYEASVGFHLYGGG